MAAAARFTVVGGGLAGLMTTIKLAEAGHQVDVLSIVPVKRSHSVCAQGGINGAVNTKGEGDHPDIHVKDTLRGGDFLAEQVSVKGMCYAAPGIIYMLDRMGVTFNRTPEGLLDFRRFGGTLHHRTAFAGATTGQQLLYALDEQVRRYEAEGKVTKYEYWEWLGMVKDESGRCIGSVALDLRTMEIRTFPAEAVCLATGGPGIVFGRSTNSIINTGTAAGRAYMEGAIYANGEFIQVHPTSIPGEDKLRLMSESVRGEGGRVWVPKKKGDTRAPREIPDSERWYFLEEKYPKYKNLVPRDVATREIFMVCRDLGMGIGGRDGVYLDVTHIPAATLDAKIKGVMEIYEKFVGDDPRHTPMIIFPGMHYSMGGLYVNFEADPRTLTPAEGSPKNQSTNIPGLYAAGEADYAFHGANRLGANSLLSCIYSGHDRRAGDGGVLEEQRQERRGPERQVLHGREEVLGGPLRHDQEDGGPGEPVPDLQGAGRADDGELHRRPLQRSAEEDGREDPRDEGALEELQRARHGQRGQPRAVLHQPAVEHAGAGRGDRHRRAACATRAAAPTTSRTSRCPSRRRRIRARIRSGWSCGRSATRSGRRRRSRSTRRRGRRSPTRTSPHRCWSPSRAGTRRQGNSTWIPHRQALPPRP